MKGIAKIKSSLDRASETLDDIQESGLPGSASKLLKSISEVIKRYASGEAKTKDEEPESKGKAESDQ
ncbi:hypothetical protein ES703_06150 [subsurface metagenome]